MKNSTLFAARLKQIRQESGISQSELAHILGVSRTCLSNYETGARQPDRELLNQIAEHFNVLTDYLIENTSASILELSEDDAQTFLYLKQYVQKRGTILNLYSLNAKNRVALLRYYAYLQTDTES